MRNNIALFFLLLLTNPLILLAQNDSLTSNKKKSSIPNIEKVYLHTDRNYYTIGESLWYKAYTVYAYNNLVFDNSKILYVELISPESKIIARNITRLESGLGHGDFMLSDSLDIKPGKYQLRAYTNWMRNYGDDFLYTKEIQIIKPSEEVVTTAKENNGSSKNKKKNPIETDDKNALQVAFFPEGGSLVEEVSSYVAFKATDQYGNPIEVEGFIYDGAGKKISLLKSQHDGMGKFIITPEKNQVYTAEITSTNNQQIKITVPQALKTGYVLSLKKMKDKNVMSIKTNAETLNQNPNTTLTMICSSRSINYYESSQALNQTSFSFLLPEDRLPEGINQITFYDDENRPQTERLVYIEKKNNIAISLTPNKSQYSPREKVNLNFSAIDEQGNPLIASYSLAVTDNGKSENNTDYNSNICSYFLMESDIRGKINNPGYYFDTSNPERLSHLDLLLLTQGWRDFIWKKIPTLDENPVFKAEKGISIYGKVKKLLSEAPKENSSVQLVLMKKNDLTILDDTTDSNGKFKFENLLFYGKTTMLLNTKNEKGKNSGMIVLDSIYNQAIAVKFNSTSINEFEKKYINDFRENIHNKNILFNIPEENQLNDVVIKAKKKEKDSGPSLYGFADYSYIPEEKGPLYSNIFLMIQIAIPNVTVSGNSVRFNRNNGPAYILVDGIETDMDLLNSISTDDVAKIEAIQGPGAAVFGSQGSNGAILIYTKQGGGVTSSKKVFHSINQQISGYQNTRYFYSPNYSENKDLENGKPDIRNTIYWNPYIQTNEKGTSEISYYNSDVNSNVKVNLEGITNTGIPIVIKTNYTVKKEPTQ